MTLPTCATCHAARIPGLTRCAQCGEAVPAVADELLALIHVPDDPLPDWYAPSRTTWDTIWRALTEAQGLELAGDIGTACAIYERLAASRTIRPEPYRRMAVIYRRIKRPADEERVVRLALAHVPATVQTWFALRLAKILSERA